MFSAREIIHSIYCVENFCFICIYDEYDCESSNAQPKSSVLNVSAFVAYTKVINITLDLCLMSS